MLDTVGRTLRRYEMLQPGDEVVCAVSGGADSMALLWAMYLLREKLDIRLSAAHFNHCLRGAESQRDEAFVRTFCGRYEIPLTVGRAPVEPGPKGLEAAARDARYAFLETLPGKLATAHTADDNAETVLMHLVRGTGLKGLGGIAPVRGRIIRPMLDVTREQVLAFLEEYHVGFVTDSSNNGDEFLRNRLRHHVMPLLKAENPRLGPNLSRMAQRLRLDEQALEIKEDFHAGLSVETLLALPQALQSRCVAAFLKHCGVREPETRHVDLVRELAASRDPSARAHLPGGITVCRQYGKLVQLKETEQPVPCGLGCPGDVMFGGTRIVTEPGEGVLPQGDMVVRSRRSGDTIRLSGGSKSLKKLFIDRKIPASQRCNIAVVADDMGVLAVEGFGYNLDRMAGDGRGIQIKFLKEI